MMKAVQTTWDEALLREVDIIVKQLNITRSDFTRRAVRKAVEEEKESLLLKQHRQGYEKYPDSVEEIKNWEREQVWEEDKEWDW